MYDTLHFLRSNIDTVITMDRISSTTNPKFTSNCNEYIGFRYRAKWST